MARRVFFLAANVSLAVALLQAFALQPETREGLSPADPAQEGFSVQPGRNGAGHNRRETGLLIPSVLLGPSARETL